MTTNQLIENINNKIHEFGFGYVLYHSLMEDISECVKEYEKDNKNENEQLRQENDILKNSIFQICDEYNLEQNDYNYYMKLIERNEDK